MHNLIWGFTAGFVVMLVAAYLKRDRPNYLSDWTSVAANMVLYTLIILVLYTGLAIYRQNAGELVAPAGILLGFLAGMSVFKLIARR